MVIHGLPIDAWVRSRQDAIAMPVADNGSRDGIRVFLQCMELKKEGPEALGERDCERLAAAQRNSAAITMKTGGRSGTQTEYQ